MAMETAILTPGMLEVFAVREGRKQERGGKGPTLRQIGEEIGLSRERVRQLIAIGERRLRLQELRRDWEQHDAHVVLWRRLMTEALQAIRKCAVREQFTVRHRQRKAVETMLLKWTGWALDLPELGPLIHLPRDKWHGPTRPFSYTRAHARQRESAIEWFMRSGMSRDAAVAYYENNERGIIAYG